MNRKNKRKPQPRRVPYPPVNTAYQSEVIATLTKQRDDALKQLSERANIEHTFKLLHVTIDEVDQAMQRLREFARAINGIVVWGGNKNPL